MHFFSLAFDTYLAKIRVNKYSDFSSNIINLLVLLKMQVNKVAKYLPITVFSGIRY